MAQAIGRLWRGDERIYSLPVKSGGSFKEGHFVIWNAGVDRHAGSDANLGATGATTRIVGMALEDSTRADGSNKAIVKVLGAGAGTEFQLPLYHTTPGSAVPTPNGQIGTAYELRNVGGNYDSVALDATTNTKIVIVGYNGTEYPLWEASLQSTTQGLLTAGSTQYSYAWVQFLGSACFGGWGR